MVKWLSEKDYKEIIGNVGKIRLPPITLNQRTLKWKSNNPLKSEAHSKVFIALRGGKLKKMNCFCGNSKVEAHHSDYSKPLKVDWFCKKHHVIEHKKLRET